ncbi:MAG TPA: RDD family protein, partial [Pyrinomonadaceae bacterium]
PKPQWRKDLSERVREIQQRKAEEAAREAEATAHSYAPPPDASPHTEAPAAESSAPALGLVPPAPAPEVNPLVAAALKRLERARQQTTTHAPRASGRGRATAAAARVAREEYEVTAEAALPVAPEAQTFVAPVAQPLEAEAEASVPVEGVAAEQTVETARPVNLVVVPSRVELENAEREKARRHIPVVLDEAYLARREAAPVAGEASPAPESSTHAQLSRRVAGGLIDLLVIAFAATPFAAIIELTNGNWADPRVAGSLGGIVVVLLFLYLMASTALAGRTWGMTLVALRAVDAGTGGAPTTGQCVRRALGYMLALATGGLGLLYAAFDAQGRALHDLLSGTITVRE